MLSTGESMTSLTVVGGVDAAILFKWLAMRVSIFLAARAAKRMSEPVAAQPARRNPDRAEILWRRPWMLGF